MKKHASKSKRKLVALLLLLVLPSFVFAQTKIITGTVTGKDDGELLPGVSVSLKGTSSGTITNVDGHFGVEVKSNSPVLTFSMIGMKTQEITVGNRSEINVIMETDAMLLEQVVVTGYSSQKKADLTGAVSVVNMSDIKDKAPGNVMKNLQGRVPGVFITSSGSPDNNANVLIRGIGTLGDNSPLYIIDGMPSKKSMNEINSLDIESIQVLKDASAATIYGSRAAHGVIIITTKKGEKGATKVDFKASLGTKTYSKSLDWLNTEERGYVQWRAAINDGTNPNFGTYSFESHKDANGNQVLDAIHFPEFIDGAKTMRASDTDWAKEVGQNAIEQNYSVTVSKGDEKGRSLLSLDYLDSQGTVKGTNFQRLSARLNSDYSFFDDKLRIGENFSLTKIRHSLINADGILGQTRSIQPIVPVHTVDGVGWGGPVSGMSDRQNPLRVIEDNAQNHKDMLRLFGDVNLDFEIIKGLHYRSMLGMDYSFTWERNMQKTYQSGFMSESIARLNNYNNRWGNWVWSNTLNYKFDLGKSNFDVLAGQEMIDFYSEWVQAGREVYTSEDPDYMYLDAGEKNKTNSGSATAYSLLSFFGKINYSYDNKYLASATLRYDGSSRFGLNNRFATFPAFSLGWRLSEEAFMENLKPVLSNLKLRYGWGKTGNQEIGDFASYGLYEALYGSDPTENPDYGTAYDIGGSGTGSLPSGFRRVQQSNPDLRWETATQNNIGVDFGFWGGSLSGSFDYFTKTTEDILIKPPYIATLGEGGDRWVNGATLDNKGYEFILSYNGKKGDLGYEITGNISGYRNKVVKLPADVINSYPGNGNDQTILGRPLNSIFGYAVEGLFKTQAQIDAAADQPNGKELGRIQYANIYNDENDQNKINDKDRTWLGVTDPKFIYGINLGLYYNQWDFSMFWNGISGGKVYNDIKGFTDFIGFFGGENYGKRTLDAWTPENPGSNIPALSANDNGENRRSSYFVESSSYVKLRSLELGYTFSKGLCKTLFMKNARVYFLGENILTFTSSDYTGIDPETPNTAYPIPTSFTVGVNITF